MKIDLEIQNIETLLVSLKFSKQRVTDAPETPKELRQDTLASIEAVTSKLRGALQSEQRCD